MTNEMQGLTGTSRKMTNKEAYQLANLAENKGYNDVGPHGVPSYNAQGGDRQFGPAPQNSMQSVGQARTDARAGDEHGSRDRRGERRSPRRATRSRRRTRTWTRTAPERSSSRSSCAGTS